MTSSFMAIAIIDSEPPELLSSITKPSSDNWRYDSLIPLSSLSYSVRESFQANDKVYDLNQLLRCSCELSGREITNTNGIRTGMQDGQRKSVGMIRLCNRLRCKILSEGRGSAGGYELRALLIQLALPEFKGVIELLTGWLF